MVCVFAAAGSEWREACHMRCTPGASMAGWRVTRKAEGRQQGSSGTRLTDPSTPGRQGSPRPPMHPRTR